MSPQEHTLWPIGRAIYINIARTQSILINEQEHLRFISKEMNGDFGVVYKNLIELIGKFSNGLEFERHERYGWLTTNLELLGTGVRCKVCLKLKQSADCIRDVCEKLRIKITSIKITAENEHFIELTNRHTFGMTEFECVKAFYDSVKEIIQTLVECGTQNDTENEMHKDTENETQNETNVGAVNELNSLKLCKNTSEANDEKNESDKSEVDVQTLAVEDDPPKNEENNEQQKCDEENVQNEPVSNTEEGNKENPSDVENAINPLEASDTNADNTDNLDEGENVNEDTPDETNQNAETIENEANQNGDETNQSETDSPEKPHGTEDQSAEAAAAAATAEGATEQPTEG
ncbi:protein-arginine kinase-like [Sitodiplosis mosellana]|uniref:protein-arginine kinase-like n=1 Tax=Sitodiplosis mosellana TaxID=263140 RepID=UPI002444EE6D|nr:protein-arginine kinase-like [Sitodiplosis mosellana]